MKETSRALKIDLQSLIGAQPVNGEVIFSQSLEEEENFRQEDLIELEVYGLSLNPDPNHPILLLKDKSGKFTLSVMTNPLEAGVTLTQSNKSIAPITPHRFAQELLKSLQIEISQCVFVQIKGTHQYVRVFFGNHPKTNSLKFRADEVMSLMLHLNIPIFASKLFIEKSKVLSIQLASMTQNVQLNHKPTLKNQPYVI
jgi:bifunctional DNase/RNase